jgi:hypothetical protein
MLCKVFLELYRIFSSLVFTSEGYLGTYLFNHSDTSNTLKPNGKYMSRFLQSQ